MEILIGCDPEVWVKKNGLFLSAFGLIKGDKANPLPVPNGAVQVDGMALEFNINPASNEQEFVYNVSDVLATLKAMVPEYEVSAVPFADFDPAYMAKQPKEALELGCDPDYNGWTREENPRPDGDRPFRTASGHVHIGWTQDKDITCPEHFSIASAVARQMDFYLGLPSLFYDDDTRRREMYGKAGACRIKSYGVEYRTLSNCWLNSEKLMAWVFRAAKEGTHQLLGNGNALFQKYGDIQNIINTSDKTEAKRILSLENIEVPCV